MTLHKSFCHLGKDDASDRPGRRLEVFPALLKSSRPPVAHSGGILRVSFSLSPVCLLDGNKPQTSSIHRHLRTNTFGGVGGCQSTLSLSARQKKIAPRIFLIKEGGEAAPKRFTNYLRVAFLVRPTRNYDQSHSLFFKPCSQPDN